MSWFIFPSNKCYIWDIYDGISNTIFLNLKSSLSNPKTQTAKQAPDDQVNVLVKHVTALQEQKVGVITAHRFYSSFFFPINRSSVTIN